MVAVVLLIVAAAGGTLGGSSFDTTNGSLTDTSNHDWNPTGSPAGNVGPLQTITCPAAAPGAGTLCGLDRTGSSSDDSFAQGPKEDDLAPSVGAGSIPPNKDDLSRFYINQEKASGNDYLYLAWERTNLLGSAHLDFEFNQSATASANGVTKVRTAGDMLITFDFGGSGVPTLSLSRWLTSGSSSACQVPSDGIPCWSALVNLTTGGFADGSVNSAPVRDYNAPVPAAGFNTLNGTTSNNGSISSTFGEAAINLTGAGVFPSTGCEHFGAADLKSRSSGQSFTSTLKDFIAPIPVNITNCGTVNIHKQDDLGAALQGAVFTLYTDAAPVGGSRGNEDTATSMTCTTDANGDCSIATVPFGNYWAVETTGVPNHDVAADQSFSLTANTPNATVSLTFVDPRQPGAVQVTKVGKNVGAGAGDHPIAGAVFSLGGVQKTTDANGNACWDGLTIGQSYTVSEVTPPSGYSGAADQSVTVTHTASCSSGTPNGATFHDSPLTDISANATSEISGATNSTIVCKDANGNTVGSSGAASDPANASATGLTPGTYTCTIVVDP